MAVLQIEKNVKGIEGLTLMTPHVYEDDRGYLFEAYNKSSLMECGIFDVFIQDNEVYSKQHVLRGFHVNRNHPQAKLIRVLDGEIFDVSIDMRPNSQTYKKCYGVKLTAAEKTQLYIPKGFAHGYLALTDARIQFKVTTHWISGDEIGFSWNSKDFDIQWPVENPILNEKDKNNPDFSVLGF